MVATLRALGGAGTVTGSKVLVEDGTTSVLLDAGLFQGLRDLRRRNWDPPPLDPTLLDAVVLSHAHLDHCGYLPALGRAGLACPVLVSPSTAALAALVLRDSAKIQEEDARYAAEAGYSRHSPPRPLYDRHDVEAVLPLLTPTPFGVRVAVGETAHVVLRPAGHILGSASTLLEIGGIRLVHSGDLGRPHHPLLVAPAPPPAADVVIVESTYGDRVHPDGALDALADVVARTIGRGGTVLVPAFAVDRTEVLLVALAQLMRAGRIPQVPVYVDSPMALEALSLYRGALAAHAGDVRPEVAAGPDPFDTGDLRVARTAAESAALNDPSAGCIVVSASGMATGGRVVHHLRAMLPQARHTVVLVGFQAPGTRGRDLVDGARSLRMHGQTVPVRAEVTTVEGLSVHADSDELLAWLGAAEAPPGRVLVMHGEPAASEHLAGRVRDELGWRADVLAAGEVVDVEAAGAP